MKNTPTPREDTSESAAISSEWRAALELLDADLRRRNAAARTVVAYRADLTALTAQQLDPADIGHRVLRRYAGLLSEQGNGATTVSRKLAATRALFRALREHGVVAQNPADLVSAPKRGQALPRVLDTQEIAALLDRIPASTPLELRDRAMFDQLPLSVPGLMSASVITVLPMFGDYYTNTFLSSGSPRTEMIGNQIERDLRGSSQSQTGASLVLLLSAMLLVLMTYYLVVTVRAQRSVAT